MDAIDDMTPRLRVRSSLREDVQQMLAVDRLAASNAVTSTAESVDVVAVDGITVDELFSLATRVGIPCAVVGTDRCRVRHYVSERATVEVELIRTGGQCSVVVRVRMTDAVDTKTVRAAPRARHVHDAVAEDARSRYVRSVFDDHVVRPPAHAARERHCLSASGVNSGVRELGRDETREGDGDASASLGEPATTKRNPMPPHPVNADVRRHRVMQGAQKVNGARCRGMHHEVLSAPILGRSASREATGDYIVRDELNDVAPEPTGLARDGEALPWCGVLIGDRHRTEYANCIHRVDRRSGGEDRAVSRLGVRHSIRFDGDGAVRDRDTRIELVDACWNDQARTIRRCVDCSLKCRRGIRDTRGIETWKVLGCCNYHRAELAVERPVRTLHTVLDVFNRLGGNGGRRIRIILPVVVKLVVRHE
ncbi:hypothetical protein GS982_01300 [Rhodococcus hoagii]|nr:hypothetical protein [Prescottella equi]